MQKIDEHAGIRSSGGTHTLLNFGQRIRGRIRKNGEMKNREQEGLTFDTFATLA